MAQKKIELVFDLNANDVTIASEKTLTLAQQVRILKQELQKTQEGTKEFEILSKKLNDTKDNFERVNVKSRELFGTLSLIPGPIGEIAGKVNGAISLLKTFSGFSFKDLSNQIKNFGNDLKEIVFNIAGLDTSTQQLDVSNQQLSESTQETTNSYADNVAKQIQVESANARVAEQLQENKKVTDGLTVSTNKTTTAIEAETVADKQLSTASQTATGSLQTQTTAQNTLTASARASAVAFGILRAILVSLGIGAIIVAVTTLVGKIGDWYTATKGTDEANQDLTDTLERLERQIGQTQQSIIEETKLLVTRGKIAGKSADELATIELNSYDKRLKASKKAAEDLRVNGEKILLNTKITEEQRKKLLEANEQAIIKNSQEYSDILVAQRQALADDELRRVENSRKLSEKRNEQLVQDAQKRKQIQEQELETLKKGQREAELTILDERQREQTIINDKYDELKKLAIKYKKDTNIIEEARYKEISELQKKYKKEDRERLIEDLNAEIEILQNNRDLDVEKLEEALIRKRDLELKNEELTNIQKQAIISKYEKDITEIKRQELENRLVNEIEKNRGNFDEQIKLYEQFIEQVLKSETYSGEEKIRVLNESNEKIRQLQEERFQAELTATQLRYGALFQYDAGYYDAVRAQYDAEEKRYKELLDQKKISQAEYDAFMKESSDARISLDKAELDSKMSNFEAVSQIFAATASLVGEQTKAGKALAIAGATIDTFVAANKVLADPTPMPTFLRFALAAATIIRGLVSVKKIVSTPIPTKGGDTGASSGPQTAGGPINVTAQRRARGGMVEGPGSEDSDSIPAYLSNGEFVVNARSTRIFQPMLKAMNDFGNAPAFAGGGLAMASNIRQNNNNPSSSLSDVISQTLSNTPIRTYVSSTEISNNQQFDRVIKSRSLI